jgi:hypothetical protein
MGPGTRWCRRRRANTNRTNPGVQLYGRTRTRSVGTPRRRVYASAASCSGYLADPDSGAFCSRDVEVRRKPLSLIYVGTTHSTKRNRELRNVAELRCFMKKIVVFSIMMAVCTSATAFAQDRHSRVSRTNVPPSDQQMSFPDEDVLGGVVTPLGAASRGNRHLHATSLLRMRQHFVQEMLKTVENF